MDGKVTIRLFAMEEGSGEALHDRPAVFDDPLYLIPSPSMPAPFNTKPMFEHVFNDEHDIEYGGKVHRVTVRYSVATTDTVTEAGTQDRGQNRIRKARPWQHRRLGAPCWPGNHARSRLVHRI